MADVANLTEAWTKASAALPLGWRMHILQLEVVMPNGTEHWMAAAVEYDAKGFPLDHRGDEHFERGHGNNPIQALLDLADRLEPIRGSTTG